MQLVGEPIRHDLFGEGVVTDLKKHSITVKFPEEEKKFLYPDAFADHLLLDDQEKQQEIQGLLQKREDAEEAKWKAVVAKEKRKQQLRRRTEKISGCSQAAFAVKDLEDAFARWQVSTGQYLSGYSKGQPRIPERMKPNTLCLITANIDGEEKERRVAGGFMVPENFLGSQCRDGIVNAHPVYRFRLAEENRPLFWPYTGVAGESQKWGRTNFKYLDNTLAERILFDIRESLRETEDYGLLNRMYQYFCKLNHLPIRESEQ